MIFTKRWLTLFLLGAIPTALIGMPFGDLMGAVAIVWYMLIAVLALVDRAVTPSPDQLTVQREVGERLSLGAENTVSLRVRNASSRQLHVTVTDSCPDSLAAGDPQRAPSIPILVEPQSRRTAQYTVIPKCRGDHRFGEIFVKVRGRLGLVERLSTLRAFHSVKVYPNMLQTAQFELMARRGRLQQMGIRKTRLQGVGRDFESLRDYLPDDEMRRIDWKATARRGKLVSRQYEVEQSQAVMILLDVGRTMLAEIDGKQKLDYAIDAALLLAYVAALSDDIVGLLVFSDEVHAFLPPRRGRAQVFAILEHLYNARASLAEADYQTALSYLQARWRKRALIVCFTDLWDPDSARQTIEELGVLQPRHLVCAVTLLDGAVLREADQQVTGIESAFKKAVAIEVIDERKKAQNALTQRGVLVVDSPADQISIALVNRYLEVKERLML